MIRHFTATVYIFHEGKVLLHRHPKLGKWLPPGGHLEENETPPEAAKREVFEETGLEIIFLEQENVKVKAYNATSFPRPYLCLLEQIPAHKDQPPHQHMDFIYLARPLSLKDDLNGFQWMGWEEVQQLDIFPDTREVLSKLLNENGLECLQPEEQSKPLS
jgi:8-oxo-dGTP pyrophosphatase MutT (NUDIX family)